jgi:hypothetical protein
MPAVFRTAPTAAVAAAVLLAAGCGGPPATASHPASQSPAPRTHASAPAVTAFVGTWSGHGSYLLVRPDGQFILSRRTYRFCGPNPPPCDTISGSTITDGDLASGQITSVSGDVATGQVTRTTDPAATPTGRITLSFAPADDTISAGTVRFCGPRAPVGHCGA